MELCLGGRRRLKPSRIIKKALIYLALILLACYFAFPYYYMATRSLMSFYEVSDVTKIHWWPESFQISNYSVVFEYFGNILNSLQIVLINGFFIPFTASLIAFPFARYKFPGKKVMFALLMSTVMLPGSVIQVPHYILYAKLGLIDTVASQWIGAFFGGNAMGIFLVIQFMRGIPKEIDNAAMIDGANKWTIYWKLILPLCMNVLIYQMVGQFIANWNNYQSALVYIMTPEKYPLATLFFFRYGNSGTESMFTHKKMAMATVMTIPCLILFIFFQKQMINGIKIGAIK